MQYPLVLDPGALTMLQRFRLLRGGCRGPLLHMRALLSRTKPTRTRIGKPLGRKRQIAIEFA
jgi:hypothetical protein